MTDMFRQTQAPTPVATAALHSPQLPTYAASDLTQDGSLALICHNDQTYVLRVTRAGKLILTK